MWLVDYGESLMDGSARRYATVKVKRQRRPRHSKRSKKSERCACLEFSSHPTLLSVLFLPFLLSAPPVFIALRLHASSFSFLVGGETTTFFLFELSADST